MNRFRDEYEMEEVARSGKKRVKHRERAQQQQKRLDKYFNRPEEDDRRSHRRAA